MKVKENCLMSQTAAEDSSESDGITPFFGLFGTPGDDNGVSGNFFFLFCFFIFGVRVVKT